MNAGFYGKLPSRGDFVRHGLPAGLVQPLDAWWQVVLPGSQALLGAGWRDAWMEAPVWRFLLAPGCCGPDAATGVWLPSTDRAGRLFPLVIAVSAAFLGDGAACSAFLDAAETIGLTAVEQDVTPEQLAAAVSAAAAEGPAARAASGGRAPAEARGSTWWTAGSSRVAPVRRQHAGMPDAAGLAAMLRD